MSAMGQGLGALALGGSGAGKTELLKDLTKAVGKKSIVFNCSASLDCSVLSKFFKVRMPNRISAGRV